MPTIRIPFPESETPVTTVLRGSHITIGRLPDNTVQIRDRTVSAHHAELIEEGDHYRVHDLGATNALFVNGQAVTDFHLREACRITFGGVDCEFDPQAAAETDQALQLLSHAEREALVREAEELKEQVGALREECGKLRLAHAEREDGAVSQLELDELAGERANLTEKVMELDREIERLKGELGVMRRDRDNLQRELNKARGPAHEVRVFPVAAKPAPVAAPVAAPAATAAPAIPAPTPVEARPKAPERQFGPALAEPAVAAQAKPVAPPAARPLNAPRATPPLAKPPIPLKGAPPTNGGGPKLMAAKPGLFGPAQPLKKTQRIQV